MPRSTATQAVPRAGEKWRYKQNRGSSTFTVTSVHAIGGYRVGLRSSVSGKTKTISLRTLRSDYERVD
jgi:hypothetical protein